MGVSFSPSGEFFASVGADEQVHIVGFVYSKWVYFAVEYFSKFCVFFWFVFVAICGNRFQAFMLMWNL